MLSIYEATLEIDRCAETETDVDAVLAKLQEVVQTRSEKIEALTSLEARIDEAEASKGSLAFSEKKEIERANKNSRAILRNIRNLDAKIQDRIARMQEELSTEMRSNNASRKFFASYSAHDAIEPGGIHINTLK